MADRNGARWVIAGCLAAAGLSLMAGNCVAQDGVVGLSQVSETGEVRPQTVGEFCRDALEDVGTYSFQTFDDGLEAKARWFTKDGWEKWKAALLKAGIGPSVKRWKQVVRSKAIGSCAVVAHKGQGQEDEWVLDGRVIRTYSDDVIQRDLAPITVEVTVVRRGEFGGKQELSISRLVEEW